MLSRFLWTVASTCLLVVWTATAFAAPCPLEKSAEVTVAGVIDGETLSFSDGTSMRLAGIFVPPGQGADNQESAAETLTSVALNRRVTPSFDKIKWDRYGRQLGHVFTSEGLWLQRELLLRGQAIAFARGKNRACANALLAAEAQAREDRRGIWQDPQYAVQTAVDIAATEAPDLKGTFQIVEGRPTAVATVKGKTYVNFGEDWRTDFTLMARTRGRVKIEQSGLMLDTLVGRRIRARGMIVHQNGPMIKLTHPEQIEVLE